VKIPPRWGETDAILGDPPKTGFNSFVFSGRFCFLGDAPKNLLAGRDFSACQPANRIPLHRR
jgi:hypothetical protein